MEWSWGQQEWSGPEDNVAGVKQSRRKGSRSGLVFGAAGVERSRGQQVWSGPGEAGL